MWGKAVRCDCSRSLKVIEIGTSRMSVGRVDFPLVGDNNLINLSRVTQFFCDIVTQMSNILFFRYFYAHFHEIRS